MRPDFIASDVHLGAVPGDTERSFLRFLEHVGSNAASLLIPGDLFDFWFEWGDVIPGRHFRVLAALARLVEAGVPVTMLGGNHDAWGGRFLREEVGVRFSRDALRIELGGRPALIAHGDGVGSGDLGYRALKRVLRSRVAITGFRVLHPELGMRLAGGVSSTEGKGEVDAAVRRRAAHIRAWALDQLREDAGLAFVVCGHAHLPTVEPVGSGRFYLNAGDWIRHRSYITVPRSGEPGLAYWEPPPQAAGA